jgi:hypothetical protein
VEQPGFAQQRIGVAGAIELGASTQRSVYPFVVGQCDRNLDRRLRPSFERDDGSRS